MGTAHDTTILDKATILSIQIGRLGVRRKVAGDRIKVADTFEQLADGEKASQPDPDRLSVSKEILACDEYDAIVSLDGEMRAKVARLALPFKLRPGAYLIADGVLEAADAVLEEWQARRPHLVDALVKVYPVAERDARSKLGDLHDPGDYLQPEEVREAFSVRVRYESWGAPQRLRSLSRKIYRREQEKTTRELSDAETEIRASMRATFAGLVAHLADVLQPAEDGKPRKFRNSTVEHLTNWIATFPARNIVDDDDLAKIVDRCREVMDGADPKSLRVAPMVQRIVRGGLADVRQQIEQLKAARRRPADDAADSEPTDPPNPAPPDDATDPEQGTAPASPGQ